MGGVANKDNGIEEPLLANEFVRGFTLQPFEAFGVVVGQQKGLQVLVELGRGLVVVALHGRLFQGAVEALHLPVGSGVGRLGKAVFDAVLVADAGEDVPLGIHLVGHIAKLGAVVGQDFMHLVRGSGQDPAQEISRQHFGGAGLQLGKGQLAGAVNGHEEIDAAFFGVHLGKVHGQAADGVVLELLFRLRRLQGRPAADAVALEEAVQGRAREVREMVSCKA